MKQRSNNSIKTKLFFAFLFFVVMMVSLLWLFQVQFLDKFYRTIKTNAVKTAANTINTSIKTESDFHEIDEIAKKNELCVVIRNQNGQELYTSNRRDPKCMIDKMNQEEINALYDQAIEEGKTISRLITTNENQQRWEEDFLNKDIDMPDQPKRIQNITYASVLKQDDDSFIVLVNAQITPVDATVETIRTQLMIITVLLMMAAMLLAYVLSKKIAKPIIRINESAKQLANGNYDVCFQENGYLEIKELSDTLHYAASELNKTAAYQKELIANISHDLRTPLTMIAGYGEMMRDIPGENTSKNVQVIVDETKRLSQLVNDLLDLSKLQAGMQEIKWTSCPLSEMIRALIHRYQKMLEMKEYQFVFASEDSYIVKGDEVKLNQVLYNLINNAIHYCGEDKKIIIRQTEVNGNVRIEIQDHGQGIAKEELPYVWDRYYKTKQHHVRAHVGTGLGLSIVKSILELHHAHYGVESTIGEGTTFWLELPIEKA